MTQIGFSFRSRQTAAVCQWGFLPILASVLCAGSSLAQTHAPRFATGAALMQQLALPSQFRWQDAPLREAMLRLGRVHRVAIVLDRRIDPDQTITVEIEQSGLLDVITAVGQGRGWGATALPGVVYVGPNQAVLPLASWYAQQNDAVGRLPRIWRERWQRTAPSSWPQLTEPRPLITGWLRDARVPVQGIEQVPHDLWPAQELPSLDLLQRLVIVLAGFQLAPKVAPDGGLQIVPLPPQVVLTRSYNVPQRRLADLSDLRRELPNVELDLQRQTLRVIGRAEDHRHVENWLHGPSIHPRESSHLANKRFTLTVKNQPLEAVLQAVAQQSELQLIWPDQSESLQRARVSLTVENATFAQLLSALLEGHGATHRIQDRRLIIVPAPAPK
jgi:hypothetical protein